MRPVGALFSKQTIVAYAFTWGIGMAIFAIAMVVTVVRAARGGPKARAEAQVQAVKLAAYYPLMMMVPMLVKWFSDIMGGVAEGIVTQSGVSFTQFLGQFAGVMTRDPLGVVVGVLGGAVVGLLLLLPVLAAMLLWLIEDIASAFGVQLLMMLIPITAALALFPNGRKWVSRAIGLLLGCLLAPVATRFAFWIMFAVGGDMLTQTSNTLYALLTIFVVASMATASPIALGYIMPMLVDRAGPVYGGAGGNPAKGGQDLMNQIGDGINHLKSGGKSAEGGGSADAAGAEALSQVGGKAAGGAAAEGAAAGVAEGAAAGSAAGPIGAVAGAALGATVAAVGAVGDMVSSASKSAAAEQLAAGGGGTSAAGGSVGLPRSGPGGGPGGSGGSPGGGGPGGGSGGASEGPADAGSSVPAFSDGGASWDDAWGGGSEFVPGDDVVDFGSGDAPGVDAPGVVDAPEMPDLGGEPVAVEPASGPSALPAEAAGRPDGFLAPPVAPGTPVMPPTRQATPGAAGQPAAPAQRSGPPPMPTPTRRHSGGGGS